VKPGRVLFNLLQVILPVGLELPDLSRHLQAVDHVVLVEEEHPDGEYRDGEYILVLHPGPYLQEESFHVAVLIHNVNLRKNAPQRKASFQHL